MLTKPEAKKLIEALFTAPRRPSPLGHLVELNHVLRLVEPLCAGGFSTTIQGDSLNVNLPEADPKPRPEAVADLCEPPAHDDGPSP